MDINKNIGYLNLPNFDNENFKKKLLKILKEVKGKKKLIIDIRNNKGGLTGNAMWLLSYLTNKKITFVFEYNNKKLKK
ncbi:S41 family peptidase [Haliovirga abyssi]|uniref:Tail specific protease domain-containing protein n=1 Tax=Haliovirga abyssi TaxID=2996794 RepID=A0AAU9D5F9_9FUSO|nr:S41 family peptidase [Haliovirga abyssi]BDU51214.1 hypothetical protein HLVA_17830 [Haliovirga abyssi]